MRRPSATLLRQCCITVAFASSFAFTSEAFAAKTTGEPGSVMNTPPDMTYFALQGDTLSAISKRFTNKTQNWTILSKRNKIGDDRAIPIGTAILVPLELLPEEDSEARVIAMAGSSTIKPLNGSEAPLNLGAVLKEGAQITTGKNGFLTLALPDDSRISIPSNSQVSLDKLRKTKYTSSPRTEIGLLQGKIESRVSSLESNKGRFEVRSPLAIAGVRGTHFRVGVNDNGIVNEVLTGGVAVAKNTAKKTNTLLLTPGKGNLIREDGVGQAVDLLPPPELNEGYAQQNRPTVQFTVNRHADANAFRVQIARDAEIQDVLTENRFKENRFRFDGLDDGAYFVRITAIDASGIEGIPLVRGFHLKARPEPPFTVGPKKKARTEKVEFSWAEAINAKAYHLQVATDADFGHVVMDKTDISEVSVTNDQLKPGNYFWRVATVIQKNEQQDQGPYSDVQAFALLPAQTMSAISDTGSSQMSFSWSSEPGQTFQVQISQDATFKQLYLNQELSQPELSIPRPPAGQYFIRVKSTDPDGYVSPFSATQKITLLPRWTDSYGNAIGSGTGMVGTNF
ncbi:FecR domain-containing protein [Undibacterium sp. SXout7W]|uniref:FecR domain-containing protein n=1 Tax=Undibacterium sp. SXout7W TaxID=3413049 RepID=UPI003BF03131